jgi:hypothetical protein
MLPTDRPRIVNHAAQVSERLGPPRDSENLTPSSQSQRDDPPSASEAHNLAPEVPDDQEPLLEEDTGDSHEDEQQRGGHHGQPNEIEVDSVRVSHTRGASSAALRSDMILPGWRRLCFGKRDVR